MNIQTKINVSRVKRLPSLRALGESSRSLLTHRFSQGEVGFNDTSLVTKFRDRAATVVFFLHSSKNRLVVSGNTGVGRKADKRVKGGKWAISRLRHHENWGSGWMDFRPPKNGGARKMRWTQKAFSLPLFFEMKEDDTAWFDRPFVRQRHRFEHLDRLGKAAIFRVFRFQSVWSAWRLFPSV